MTTFLVSVGIGLSTAAILSLSAVAFTLEYAVSRVANFAHGEFLTLGAYAAYSGQALFHPVPAPARREPTRPRGSTRPTASGPMAASTCW